VTTNRTPQDWARLGGLAARFRPHQGKPLTDAQRTQFGIDELLAAGYIEPFAGGHSLTYAGDRAAAKQERLLAEEAELAKAAEARAPR
jgi:hypothetical protein